MKKEKLIHISDETKDLLNDFFETLREKLTSKDSISNVDKAINDIQNLPSVPENDISVFFEYEDTSFFVNVLDYKIELVNYLRESYSSGTESYPQFVFRYELDGYTEETGNLDEFKHLLLNSLIEVRENDISISDEE